MSGNFVPDALELYDTMVEVIDPRAQVVIARRRLGGYVSQVLPDGRVVEYLETADAIPQMQIVRLTLRGG